jgi:hypothetical protein
MRHLGSVIGQRSHHAFVSHVDRSELMLALIAQLCAGDL